MPLPSNIRTTFFTFSMYVLNIGCRYPHKKSMHFFLFIPTTSPFFYRSVTAKFSSFFRYLNLETKRLLLEPSKTLSSPIEATMNTYWHREFTPISYLTVFTTMLKTANLLIQYSLERIFIFLLFFFNFFLFSPHN